MEGKRQAKISRLIQKELSEIFRRQTAALGNVIVSVSAVRVSPDLSKTCRYELAQAVKSTLRKCPDLSFYLDDSLDYVENIDRLLASDPHLHDEIKTPDETE